MLAYFTRRVETATENWDTWEKRKKKHPHVADDDECYGSSFHRMCWTEKISDHNKIRSVDKC
jgi:hypothetical protein